MNSRYLKWFHGIEKTLWALFAPFGNLCERCAQKTISEVETNRRGNRDAWCCCMIDNQVHDNWDALNEIQSKSNRNWYEPLKNRERPRMPGNGPCPALGPKGCLLKKHRPVTCTTQLCSKMIEVFRLLKITSKPSHSALQIEDLIDLPDILPALYGTDKRRKVTQSDVDSYIASVRAITQKFAAIPQADRQKAIDRVLPAVRSN